MPPKPTPEQLAAAGFGGNKGRRQQRPLLAKPTRGGPMKDSASTSTPSLGGLAGSSQAGEKSLPGQQQQQPEEAGPPSLSPSQFGPLPEAPVFAPRPQARLLSETVATGEGDLAAQLNQALSKNAELDDANRDYYDKLAVRDQQIDELTRERDALKRNLADEKRLHGGITSNLRDAEASATQSDRALAKEQDAHSKTASELAALKEKEAETRQLLANLRKDIKTDREERDIIRAERDALETDLKLAQRDIDTLEKQLAEHDDAGTARAFLEVIHEEVEEQFAQEGKDLTPDNFAAHFRRVSEQAAMNRGVSGDSTNSQPQDDADAKRRSTGNRTVSNMAQELDAAQQEFDSDDEGNAVNDTDNLHIPKRRPQSTGDDISSSAYTITEQKQKIQDQDREIEKMRAQIAQLEDQVKEAEQMRTQIAKLEGDHEEHIDRLERRESQYKAEIAKQQAHIEEREQYHQDMREAHDAHISKLEDTIWQVRDHTRLQTRVNERAALREADADDSPETEEEKLEKAEASKIQPWQVSPPFDWVEVERPTATTFDADTQTDFPQAAATSTETTTGRRPFQIVRYTEKVRDSTLSEAFFRSPLWLQIFLAFATLLLLTFGIRGWHQENMWLAANAPALHQIRSHQAERAIMGKIWSVLEESVGYDSRLLG
ncbi:hypothetical protein CKM354_000870700 [Cercospora kikuchii]|uniref:Uncharacterized protein n=1 Tax=Cercospora kikuchii TaxID=84275 RepID=A0A9P3CRY9_9PEZI|nr:uncharacterized protein CKM354_000870700 [Cercospora kikuchii]GIZ45545.1 hypothetical protein CKM354_000870700 [Cercospora kikuchii]